MSYSSSPAFFVHSSFAFGVVSTIDQQLVEEMRCSMITCHSQQSHVQARIDYLRLCYLTTYKEGLRIWVWHVTCGGYPWYFPTKSKERIARFLKGLRLCALSPCVLESKTIHRSILSNRLLFSFISTYFLSQNTIESADINQLIEQSLQHWCDPFMENILVFLLPPFFYMLY